MIKTISRCHACATAGGYFFDRLKQPSDLPMAAVLSSCDFYAHFGTGLIENLCRELPAFRNAVGEAVQRIRAGCGTAIERRIKNCRLRIVGFIEKRIGGCIFYIIAGTVFYKIAVFVRYFRKCVANADGVSEIMARHAVRTVRRDALRLCKPFAVNLFIHEPENYAAF